MARSVFLVWLGVIASACATPHRVPDDARVNPATGASLSELGPPAARYTTDPDDGPGNGLGNGLGVGNGLGPGGGARLTPGQLALAARLDSALAARGTRAAPDQALTTMAGVFLDSAARSGSIDTVDVERVARHLGFPGTILAACVFPVAPPPPAGADDTWRQSLAELAPNLAVTRYGLAVSESLGMAAVVFGDMSVALESPLPRQLPRTGSLRLRGALGPRFAFGHLYVTAPDGRVSETPIAKRDFDLPLSLPTVGVYRVELMGDGPTGPTVVMNVPISVGVDPDREAALPSGPPAGVRLEAGQTRGTAATGPPLPVAAFEARMLDLLNGARARAGLGPLRSDPQLAAVALAHAEDMERAHFFGHVSPSTGSAADRLDRAGIEVSTSGENLSQASTPEESHEGLMQSPGHRANMLGARFTHVGIGVVRTPETPPRYLATLLFARRPPAGYAWTATDAVAAIAALRAHHGVPPAAVDGGLRTAAESGMAAFLATGTTAAAAAASNAAFVAEATRDAARRRSQATATRSACTHFFEILDPEQLESLPVLVDPRLARMGVAVGARGGDGRIPRFAVIVVSEGLPCAGQ
jgi:uncharacterized protein YkwD